MTRACVCASAQAHAVDLWETHGCSVPSCASSRVRVRVRACVCAELGVDDNRLHRRHGGFSSAMLVGNCNTCLAQVEVPVSVLAGWTFEGCGLSGDASRRLLRRLVQEKVVDKRQVAAGQTPSCNPSLTDSGPVTCTSTPQNNPGEGKMHERRECFYRNELKLLLILLRLQGVFLSTRLCLCLARSPHRVIACCHQKSWFLTHRLHVRVSQTTVR